MSADDGCQSASSTYFFDRVSASTNYDMQEADACITISQRVSVKTSYGKSSGDIGKKTILKKYDLPTQGKIRFIPEKNGNLTKL